MTKVTHTSAIIAGKKSSSRDEAKATLEQWIMVMQPIDLFIISLVFVCILCRRVSHSERAIWRSPRPPLLWRRDDVERRRRSSPFEWCHPSLIISTDRKREQQNLQENDMSQTLVLLSPSPFSSVASPYTPLHRCRWNYIKRDLL